MLNLLQRGRELLVRAGNMLQPIFLLFVRVYWGWQFFETGWGKIGHLGKVMGYFGTLGIPFPDTSAVFVSLLELVGGVCLMFGLASRVFSLLLFFDMLVAYIVADRAALVSFASDPSQFYNAAEFTFLFSMAIIFVFGPGLIAIDTWIERKLQPRHRQLEVHA